MKKHKCPECHGTGEITVLGSLLTWVSNTLFVGMMMLLLCICLARAVGCQSADIEIRTNDMQESDERDRTDSGESGVSE